MSHCLSAKRKSLHKLGTVSLISKKEYPFSAKSNNEHTVYENKFMEKNVCRRRKINIIEGLAASDISKFSILLWIENAIVFAYRL